MSRRILLLLTALATAGVGCSNQADKQAAPTSAVATPPAAIASPTATASAKAVAEGEIQLPFASEGDRTETTQQPLGTESQLAPNGLGRINRRQGIVPVAHIVSTAETIELSTGADGTTTSASLWLPTSPRPVGLVLIHEMGGLNAAVRREGEGLAKLGFVTLAPSLFGGQVPASRADSVRLAPRLQQAVARVTLAEAAGALREQAQQPNLPLVVVGCGLGGAAALDFALEGDPAPAGVVLIYADFPGDPAGLQHMAQRLKERHVALLGIFADRDAWVTPARVADLSAALLAAGTDHKIETITTEPGFMLSESMDPGVAGYRDVARQLIDEFSSRLVAQ